MNAALKAGERWGVPAYEIERQSQIREGSRGTHIASVAAGNHNCVCRKADIAGVFIAVPKKDSADRHSRSFYDSTRIADAVDYLSNSLASSRKRL